MKNIIPSKNQWNNWKMPTRIGYISAVITFLAFVFAVLIFVISEFSNNKRDKISERRHNELLAEIRGTRPEDASEELKKEIRTVTERISNPTTADDFYLKGYAASIDKNYETAIKHYSKAIELNPNYAAAYSGMGFLYLQKGISDEEYPDKEYLDKAKEYFKKAIELEPNHNNIEFGYKLMGITYHLTGYYDNAIECYKEYLNVKSDANTYSALGETHFSKGEDDKAIECFKKAIDIEPNYANAYNGMGVVYDSKTEYDKAIAYIDKAIKLKPDYAIAYFNLAGVYLHKNQDAIENSIKNNSADNKTMEIYYKIIDLYKKAAKLGNEPSQKYLTDLGIAW